MYVCLYIQYGETKDCNFPVLKETKRPFCLSSNGFHWKCEFISHSHSPPLTPLNTLPLPPSTLFPIASIRISRSLQQRLLSCWTARASGCWQSTMRHKNGPPSRTKRPLKRLFLIKHAVPTVSATNQATNQPSIRTSEHQSFS